MQGRGERALFDAAEPHTTHQLAASLRARGRRMQRRDGLTSGPLTGEAGRVDVVARRVSSVTDERCPYCHDALATGAGDAPDEDRIPCGGCGTVHHRACVEELGRCTIAGCERPMAAPRRAAAAAVGAAATEAVRRRLAARAADFVSAHCTPAPPLPSDRRPIAELDGFFGFLKTAAPPAEAPPPPADVPTDGRRPSADRARGFVRAHCAEAERVDPPPRDMVEASERAERRQLAHLAAPAGEVSLSARRLASALGAIDACRLPDWQQKAELLRHVAAIEREAAPGELDPVVGRIAPAEAELRADALEERAALAEAKARRVYKVIGLTFIGLVALVLMLFAYILWVL